MHPVLRHDEILLFDLRADRVRVARMAVKLILIAGDQGVELFLQLPAVLPRAGVDLLVRLMENAGKEAEIPGPQTFDVPVADRVFQMVGKGVGLHDLPVIAGKGVTLQKALETHAGLKFRLRGELFRVFRDGDAVRLALVIQPG